MIALSSPAPSGATGSSPAPAHHAKLGPLAETALSAIAHGHRLPASWSVGRASRHGTTYGVFLRGTTTALAIASTGAVPGTVLSVGATAEATLGELSLLAALPGITEVELAGQAKKQLDQSVPAIHASESSHANTAGVPHFWSGIGGSTETETGGGSKVWSAPTVGSCSGAGETPSLFGGNVYAHDSGEINAFNASTGSAGSSTMASSVAFDGTTSFFVYFDTLTAVSSNGTTLWTWTASSVLSAPIVANGNVYVATTGEVYALPAAGNGTATNAPTWSASTGTSAQPTIAVGNGYLLVLAGTQVVAFGDSVVTHSTDDVTANQIDAAHDGDQPTDSLTTPLAMSSKWTANLSGTISYPLIANGMVYAAVDPTGGAGNSVLYALNIASGLTYWGPIDLGGTQAYVNENFGITYDNGRVFSDNSDGVVNAFDASSGQAIWADQLRTVEGDPTALNGALYAGASGSATRIPNSGRQIVAIGESSGAVLWTYQLSSTSRAATPRYRQTGSISRPSAPPSRTCQWAW